MNKLNGVNSLLIAFKKIGSLEQFFYGDKIIIMILLWRYQH